MENGEPPKRHVLDPFHRISKADADAKYSGVAAAVENGARGRDGDRDGDGETITTDTFTLVGVVRCTEAAAHIASGAVIAYADRDAAVRDDERAVVETLALVATLGGRPAHIPPPSAPQ